MLKRALEPIKWVVFYWVNRFADAISNGASRPKTTIVNYQDAETYNWVFCSTLGEVNACKPFIERVYQQSKQMVLLTDRYCYAESYQKYFPNAIIVELNGTVDEPRVLMAKMPPQALYVCEIPCSPHDAPCRLSYSLIRSVRKHTPAIYLINGWLYGYEPASRADSLERLFFNQDYIELFTKLTVQTDDVKDVLVSKGITPEKIIVSGNMKFDETGNMRAQTLDTKSDEIISQLSASNRLVLTAGCLANIEEINRLLFSAKEWQNKHQKLLIILAPRHPENTHFMANLEQALSDSGLHYEYKTKVASPNLNHVQLLVLDTIGELKAYFNAADLCYMGQNHNLLEPLSFSKKTITTLGWEATYPSYPVYQILKQHNLIHVCQPDGLTDLIDGFLVTGDFAGPDTAVLKNLKGATECNLREIPIH
jgi:3-deoxy-D-manno-octulosonic-acid transferase